MKWLASVCNVLCVMVLVMPSIGYAEVDVVPISGVILQNNDDTVRVQDDFYEHINGHWLKHTDIPADKSRWGAFDALALAVLKQTHEIILDVLQEETSTSSPNKQKIKALYDSFMDTATINHLGLTPLKPFWNKIDALQDKKDVPIWIAYSNTVGIDAPHDFSVHADAKNPTRYVIDFTQSGLGLPDRDYYLKEEDTKLSAIKKAYQAHIEKMLQKMGDNDALVHAKEIVQLETQLAQIQWDNVALRDPIKTYNKIRRKNLHVFSPYYDLNLYLKGLGVSSDISHVIISQPSYFKAWAKLFHETPLSTWKIYFKWHTLLAYAPLLSSEIADEHFAFYGTVLKGIPVQEERYKRAVRAVNHHLGEALGELYVARYFPPTYQAKMNQLVDYLLLAYQKSIDQLDWIGNKTKRAAQKKLAALTVKIGHPNKWRDYSQLVMDRTDLVGNTMRSHQFIAQYYLHKVGGEVDKTEWQMTPQTVNAYYDPEKNEIVFPAAILQPPFFNPQADDAINYGAIGAVIGHEISHGFDDQGSQYDEKGRLRNWWTKSDHQQFASKTAALVAQYNAYSPIPGYFINGELTLGENIADNAGLAIAYKAYRLSRQRQTQVVMDGFTPEQRFYIGFGQIWQTKTREAALLMQLKTDPHSPADFRANGTVKNQPGFYEAFDVKEGDKMYLSPQKRVIIW